MGSVEIGKYAIRLWQVGIVVDGGTVYSRIV